MTGLYNSFVGFLKVSRVPNLGIIGLTQLSTAFFLLDKKVLDPNLLLIVASTMMIAASGYIINDYYDQKIDMINRPDRVIVGIAFNRRFALIFHSAINLLAIGIGLWVDIAVGLAHFFSGFLLWYYSVHLRRLPLIGNLIIAMLTGLTLIILLLYFRQSSGLVFTYALFAFLMVLIREIIKDIQDVKGESAFGCISVPVIWGIRGAKFLIYLIVFAGSALLVQFLTSEMNRVLQIYFLLLSPIFLWFTYRLYRADTHDDFTFLHRFCNAIIFTGIISIPFN